LTRKSTRGTLGLSNGGYHLYFVIDCTRQQILFSSNNLDEAQVELAHLQKVYNKKNKRVLLTIVSKDTAEELEEEWRDFGDELPDRD
jgi:penicillin-binding protein-related factor A (putative recombinase)